MDKLPRLPFGGAAFRAGVFFDSNRVRRRCLWHPRHAGVRRRTSAPRTARFRRSVKSVGRFRPQVPSLVSSAPPPPPAFAIGFGCARHSEFVRLCEAAPELLCPFDEGVSPPSPEPRLGPLNFSKERELGRGPLVELAAIVFFNPRARPTVRRQPALRRPISFRRPSCRPRSSGAGSLTLPGELAIRPARATLTTTSGYPDALLDKHPASRASDDERIEVSFYRPPLLSAAVGGRLNSFPSATGV